MWIRNAKTFWTGVLYLVIGLGAVIVAQENPMGTLSQMGPAYFPTIVGALLALLGVVLVGMSFVGSVTHLSPVAWRTLAPILVGPMVWAMIVTHAGLIVSLFVELLLVRLAAKEGSLWVTLLLALILTAGIACLFVGAMGLRVPLWPTMSGAWLGLS